MKRNGWNIQAECEEGKKRKMEWNRSDGFRSSSADPQLSFCSSLRELKPERKGNERRSSFKVSFVGRKRRERKKALSLKSLFHSI